MKIQELYLFLTISEFYFDCFLLYTTKIIYVLYIKIAQNFTRKRLANSQRGMMF